MITGFVIYLLMTAAYITLSVFEKFEIAAFIALATSVIQLFGYTYSSISLMQMMRKRHEVEFQKKKWNMGTISIMVCILLMAQIGTYAYLIIIEGD